MENINILQKTIDYIEENLKTEVDLQMLGSQNARKN